MYVTIDGIKVDTQVVSTQSFRMRTFSERMYDVLSNAKRRMNEMQNGTWISPAGQLIIDKMNALEPQIQMQRETVGRFCNFLDRTVRTYETTEDRRIGDALDVN